MTKTVALFLLCLPFTAAAAAAQTSATLTGVVVDITGGALSAATVSARNTETNVVRETSTDAAGRFVLGGLPIGEYEVRASLKGFRTLSRTGLRLSVGEQASLTLTLQVGAAEVVTVVGRHVADQHANVRAELSRRPANHRADSHQRP